MAIVTVSYSLYARELESDNIIFFSKVPFDFPQDDLAFPLAQRQTGATNRRNIAYDL